MRTLRTGVESETTLSRRKLITNGTVLGLVWSLLPRNVRANESDSLAVPLGAADQAADRVRGLIYGGVLGDALGGPVEFQEGPAIDAVLPRLRRWPDNQKWNEATRERLATSLKLLAYQGLRPGAESYAQWRRDAPAGTTTDDTRHKIVLMRMIRRLITENAFPADARTLAKEYISFTPIEGVQPEGELLELCEDGFREYRFAARWLLGDRNPSRAKPVERLWAGIDTCSGQMMLLPWAAAYPGDPNGAYETAYAFNFVDAPGARDMAAALVAGLAAVLVDVRPDETITERWLRLWQTMRDTDPYGYSQVPFAGRPLHRWMDLAQHLVDQAQGSPKRLYHLLETEGRPYYWWDAHFTLLVPIAILRFCDYDPLASIHMTLDFGHDTDSYAQVMTAMIGAVHGDSIFDSSMLEVVRERTRIDYGEDLDEWCSLLASIAKKTQSGFPVVRRLTDG
jgi:ADP-ribosylglycohydrolase